MKKRAFLHTTAVGAVTLLSTSVHAKAGATQSGGPALLTVTGAISKVNRGALDPALDQLMVKQKLSFDRAFTFDFAALDRLPRQTISPVIEYDEKAHRLSGPTIADVLKTVGAAANASVLLRAIDGYAVRVEGSDLRKYRFIIASRLDEQPMALGGLGPLWAVYDADRFPDMAAKPLNQRFGLCPWGLYYIHVAPQ
jgi:hypothetical protein